MIKGTDIVDVVFVTKQNGWVTAALDRKSAKWVMERWFAAWNHRIKGTGLEQDAANDFFRGVFAANIKGEGDEIFPVAMIAWSEVVGLYVKERTLTAQDKMVTTMEKLVKEVGKGDEWQQKDENGE